MPARGEMWLLSYKNTVVSISSRVSLVCVPLVLMWVVLAWVLISATPLEPYRQMFMALYTNNTPRRAKITPGTAMRANWDPSMITLELIILQYQILKLSTSIGCFKKGKS